MSQADATPQQLKRDRFLRVAERRTQVVLEKLRVLGNCASKNAYEYTDKDVETIFAAIEHQLERTKARFAARKPAKFRLQRDGG